MPANDTYWRNLKKMHVVFALSAIGLFAVTIGMMWKDHADEWRDYQTTFDRIEEIRLESQIAADTTEEYEAKVSDLEKKLEAANKRYADNKGDIEDDIEQKQYELNLAERDVRAQRAFRDKARADYDLAVRDEKEAAAERLKEQFDIEQQKVDEQELLVQNLTGELNQLKAQQQEMRDQITAIETELAATRKEIERLETTKERIAPESSLAYYKRKVMQWPIIDGFNSPHQIKQVWLPDLKITLGMAQTARFDRCQTCHLGIDRVETGNVPTFPHSEDLVATSKADKEQVEKWVKENKFPHPYATHPNPDLFLTSSSPHPMQEFGCTICHDGQGSGTTFDNVQHTPNNPFEKDHWEEKYHYHYNHFWEYPMQPERFRESSCLKCHHSVVELEASPQFGNSAPKVVKGFHTIQQYGCFGCHEMHGQDGSNAIGPDLRLEPNHYAIALAIESASKGKLSADKQNGEKSSAGKTDSRLQKILELANDVASAPEDSQQEREELQELVLADKTLDAPLFDARIHALADDLKDVENPGSYRKVGPALRYLDKKTYLGWVEHWTSKPQDFRPSTRMPQFFHLTNQEDKTAEAYQPVQIAAISHYLLSKSQTLDLLSPKEGYEPDAERGKQLFAERGCLSCHSHKDFPGIDSDFGPNLDKVYAKLKSGDEGFQWLYSWIREPHRYSKRSKMPNLYLDPYVPKGQDQNNEENVVDPAADIAAYLLQERENQENTLTYEPYNVDTFGVVLARAGEDREAVADVVADVTGLNEDEVERMLNALPQVIRAEMPKDEAGQLVSRLEKAGGEANAVSNLDRLVELYLSQALTINQMQELGKTRLYPYKPEQIKGDEIELVYEGEGQPSDEDWRNMKLNYVGRRTISQYGCYGCHDIPGFEAAKPIGVALQDWGRKDTSRLAFEHITEFLHHHETYNVVLTEYGENRDQVQKILAVSTELAPEESSLPKALPQVIDTNVSKADADALIKRLEDAGAEAVATARPTVTQEVDQAIKRAKAEEFKTPEEQEDALSLAYYYDSIQHHQRPGFIWQKLRMPRSYDYRKTETKRYDERLRMPRFPLDNEQIEAVATFVLGLTAEPPADKYLFKPQAAKEARYEGEHLLRKYNCTSCHMVELPEVQYSILPRKDRESAIDWLVDNRDALTKDELTAEIRAEETDEGTPASFPPAYRQIHEKAQKQAGIGLNELAKEADKAAGDDEDAFRTYLDRWFVEHPQVLAATYADALTDPGTQEQGMTRDQIVDWFVDARELLVNGELKTYPEDIERINQLCQFFGMDTDVAGIARLANLRPESVGRRLTAQQIEDGFRANLMTWFENHPEVLLTEVPDASKGKLPEGVRALFKVKPPVSGVTGLTNDNGDAVLRFHGMGVLSEGEYSYTLWDTLDVEGRIMLPTSRMLFTPEQVVSLSDGRGGKFANWLVERLSGGALDKISKAWQASPPPLVGEGLKVQTPWLFNFLKNPDRIRNETVLRMPQFNMSDAEARALANYFAAVDDAEYPYQDLPQRDPGYGPRMDQVFEKQFPKEAEETDYLAQSWTLFGKFKACRQCHSIAGDELQVTDPTQLTHGPDLETRLARRFRPDYLDAWLHSPQWVLPYTAMVGPTAAPEPQYFGGKPAVQVEAIRDAILNYNEMLQRVGKIEPPPPAQAAPPGAGAADNPGVESQPNNPGGQGNAAAAENPDQGQNQQ